MRLTILASTDPVLALHAAQGRARDGDTVSVVLLDDGAALGRAGHDAGGLVRDAVAAGVQISAHDDALRRRAIAGEALAAGVTPADLDAVADLLAERADRVLWL